MSAGVHFPPSRCPTVVPGLNSGRKEWTVLQCLKVSFNEVVGALKDTLHDLEKVRMTAPNDPELRELKHEIRKMIERAEQQATKGQTA